MCLANLVECRPTLRNGVAVKEALLNYLAKAATHWGNQPQNFLEDKLKIAHLLELFQRQCFLTCQLLLFGTHGG